MNQESGTPGFLAPSPSDTNLQHPNKKRSKISYTREFLFSLANIDTAVKLRREVQLSFSGLFADAPGLLSTPLSVPDYGCHKMVLQNSSVLDNANHLLHRSNEPYRPPCHHKALPPSSRDGNDLINSHTPGSSDSTNQEKGEEKRWRKDTIRLPKDDIWYSHEYSEALLMSPTATSLNTLQSSSNVINQQSVQGAVRGDDVQPSILPETTNSCSAQHQQGQDFTNETVGHPKGTPRVMEPLQNCRNIQKNLCDVEYELQLSKTAVCVYGSPRRIAKSDVSDSEGSVSPPVEDEKQSIPLADKCESAPAHCEGILSLQGVKQAISVSMKLNSTSPGFQIQHDLESNSYRNSLDGKSNSSFELHLPDEESLTSYDGPFFMPDVENSSVVDNSISSPETNPIEADVFSPSSTRDMIEKLVESILSDENCPAPHLDDFIVHHGAGLESYGQSSYTQICSNHSNLGRDEESHTSFQRNSMDSPIYSSATCHPFPSNTTCQPFSFFHDGLRRFHDHLRRFDHEVGQTMFQQMINPGKLALRPLCASQSEMTPHLPLEMDSYSQTLNSMQSGTLGYQEPCYGGLMGPNPGSRSNRNINQVVLDSLVDMNLRAREWHPYVGGF